MSCGCSAFDGRNEMDGLDLSNEEKFNNVVTDGDDWIGVGDEGFANVVTDGDDWIGVGEEDFMVEDEDFDSFLTQQARNRRARRKELQAGGMSRKEARKQSLLDVPRQPIGQAIGEISGQAQAQTTNLNEKIQETLPTTNDGGDLGDEDDQQGMSKGTKIGIGVLVVALLGIGGYFAYKKFKG